MSIAIHWVLGYDTKEYILQIIWDSLDENTK